MAVNNSDLPDDLLDALPNQEIAGQIRQYGMRTTLELFAAKIKAEDEAWHEKCLKEADDHCHGCKRQPKVWHGKRMDGMDGYHVYYTHPCDGCIRNPLYKDHYEIEGTE
jgi:hypothetical protein